MGTLNVSRQVDSATVEEFAFDVDESTPDFMVSSFTEWLANHIESGAAFEDGQTLQYGYAILSCRLQSKVLRLLAPDFQSMPINWVSDLGRAFSILAAHRYTPETFGFVPDIPALNSSAIIGQRFDQMPMFASRLVPDESNPNDSGWFIGSTLDDVDNNDPDQLKAISLYEAMIAVPHVLDFLSLPVGCMVTFTGDNFAVYRDDEALEIPKGSFLDRRLNEQ